MKVDSSNQKILNLIAQGIYDKKGKNIFVLDVRGINSMTDFFVIAEGSVDRHNKSIAEHLMEILDPIVGKPIYSEGLVNSDWIVLDYGEFVIHLFIPELREKYTLEKLWSAGSIVDVSIETKLSNLQTPLTVS